MPLTDAAGPRAPRYTGRARAALRAALAASALLAAAALPACERGEPGASASEGPGPPVPPPPAEGPRPHARLRVEGFGRIEIELFPGLAPKTVANFVDLAERDFYDGTTFHRVVPGFMIQGGDPNSKNRDPRDDGQGGPDHSIPDEFSDVSHLRGIVAMGNRGYPDTGGSQFFILVSDARHLDGRHAVFGRVVEGMDVVDAIAEVERDQYGRWGARDRPLEDVVIADVAIERPSAADAAAAPRTPQAEAGAGAG